MIMMPYLTQFARVIAISLIFFYSSLGLAAPSNTKVQSIKNLIVDLAVFPEGIGYDSSSKLFYVGSLTSSTIYQVNLKGEIQPFFTDPQLISSAAVQVDKDNQRLLVASLDLGVSKYSGNASKSKLAGLGVYSLKTGRKIHYVNLAKDLPGAHLANDIAVDSQGNIYITDSSSPHIYKIDNNYRTSLFLNDAEFTGKGFNLNGLVYHKDGFLIAAKYNSNSLYRIPVDDPAAFKKIKLNYSLTGPDGLILLSESELAVIQNINGGKVSVIESTDKWSSAKHINSTILDNAYPTSGVRLGDGVAVIDGHINQLFSDKSNGVKSFSIIFLNGL